MPNIIDANGLQTKTREEILTELRTAFETIYGPDVNLDSDTPDGQIIGIFAQAAVDQLELLAQVYNFFDPDNAIGRILDQRVAINGIQRQGGSFTTTNITVVTSQPNVYLPGLDQSDEDPFIVADDAGTEFVLTISQNVVSPGSHVFEFRAVEPGEVLTIPNTITIPVTIILGVDSVNNPTTYTVLGQNEESDEVLRVRRQQSVSLASQGYLTGLIAALRNVTGVVSANVYENNTSVPDYDSGSSGPNVPPHSIWVVVQGTPAAADIAQAIYTKRNAGCGMRGDVTYIITQSDGTPFTVRWDTVGTEPLYIRFNATSLDGINPPNIALIKSQLPQLFTPGVGEQVNITELGTLIQQIDPNTLVTDAGFAYAVTDPLPWADVLAPSSRANFFSVAEANIIVLPIILSPVQITVDPLEVVQFTPLGGLAPFTFSMDANPSGGTVNATTGEYTAGGVSGTDIVRVTDDEGNFSIATVLVT